MPPEFVTAESLQPAVQQQLQQASKAAAGTSLIATGNNGLNAPTANPATNFADTTTNQLVSVQQSGTGVGLTATAPTNSAIVGTTNANAISGIVAGVEDVSSLNAARGRVRTGHQQLIDSTRHRSVRPSR